MHRFFQKKGSYRDVPIQVKTSATMHSIYTHCAYASRQHVGDANP